MAMTPAETTGSSYRSGHNGYGSPESEQSTKSPPFGFGRFYNKTSTAKKGSDDDGTPPVKPKPKKRGPKPDTKPATSRRVELNRQAQRSHRERRENRLKDAELRAINLKDLYEETVKERNLLQAENQKLRQMLADHGISYTSDMPTIKHETSSSDSFSGSFRTPSSASRTLSPPPLQQHNQHKQVQLPESNFDCGKAGVDFVVALEEPCWSHIRILWNTSEESLLLEDIASSPDSKVVDFGHAHMLTCPPGHQLMDPDGIYRQTTPDMPFTDLWKLLESSRTVGPRNSNTELTPVEALVEIMGDKRFALLTAHDFERIKLVLLEKVRCFGYGATVQRYEVRDALDNFMVQRMERMEL